MSVDHDFNRVKPGHINMGRALRSLSMKTDQSRQLTLSIPTVYQKDSYGVETSTVQVPAIEIPGLNALVSPITTKDFTLAKEGRYIAGAARIYMPSMDQIFKKLNQDNNDFFPNFGYQSSTRPITNTNAVMKDYFRSVDGLMNAVLYDSEATIFDSQPVTYADGTANWSCTTDYSAELGAHWTLLNGTNALSSDYDSVTLTTSGSNGDAGTFWLWMQNGTPQVSLADRVTFEVKMTNMESRFMFLVCQANSAQSAFPYICYGSTSATANSNNLDVPSDSRWYKIDLPFTSGSLTDGSATHWTNYIPVNQYDGGDESGDKVTGDAIAITQTPTAGSITSGDFPWGGGGDSMFFGFRVFRKANKDCTFTIRKIRFYRSIPWSVHSVKDYNTDYMVVNCVRTDGDSMQRQEAYAEQAPEL